ncbi:TetR/AcrR family transcriptional regulator [Microlunatus speluncae]|uniref:TetR/AcrR family transcriptional regulator n=1 Tax=Microlunatus speluncae TaxID=2594267 RepID=UPI001266504E|nr:TetR/AcrR family transcriptional regulator [Microlunatus speluncae]
MNTIQPRRTQAERRAASRTALVEAAARGIARHGYTRLSLADVAREAGYTRGALYHQFPGKEELALAIVEWVTETWQAEVGHLFDIDADPASTLIAVARQHTVYCRRDIAAVMQMLQIEFNQRDHPVGAAVGELIDRLAARCRRLIMAGRRDGSIPPGPPATHTAQAYLAVIEAVAIAVAGHRPHDVELTERAVRGVLGLS